MKKTFVQWLGEVDKACWAKCGCSYKDLPDMPLRDWYDSNVTPKGAASRLAKEMNN